MYSFLLSSVLVTSATAQEDTFYNHSFPKKGVQWPEPRNGRIQKNCEILCDQDYGSDLSLRDCVYDCANERVAVGEIEVSAQCIPYDDSTVDASTVQAIVQENVNMFKTSPEHAKAEKFTIKVEVVDCTQIKPLVGDEVSKEDFSMDFSGVGEGGNEFTIRADTVFGVVNAITTIDNMIEGVNFDVHSDLFENKQQLEYNGAQNLFQTALGTDTVYTFPYDAFQMVDGPKYSYRGVMIDTARNFIPVAKMKEIIDVMALSKLNVLHWHATDDQSFPLALATKKGDNGTLVNDDRDALKIQLNGELNVTEAVHGDVSKGFFAGAYGPGLTYDRDDIYDIYTYAWIRNVRIVMEIDSPAHARSWGSGERKECSNEAAGASFQDKYTENCPTRYGEYSDGPDSDYLNMCFGVKYQRGENCLQQPCGPLSIMLDSNGYPKTTKPLTMFKGFVDALMLEFEANPKNTNSAAAQAIYGDQALLEAGEYFHLGLDELEKGCLGELGSHDAMEVWLSSIISYTNSKNLNAIGWHDFLLHYTSAEITALTENMVPQFWGFDDVEATNNLLTNNTVGYIWSPSESTYLDCGLGNNAVSGFDSWCRPWKNFWHLYNMDPDLFAEHRSIKNLQNSSLFAFGAEAPLWGEQGTPGNVLPRLFPRAAAMAQPLWHGRATSLDEDGEDQNSTLQRVTGVLDGYDFSQHNTNDFRNEYEWNDWTYAVGHRNYGVQPEKTVYCAMQGLDGTVMCTHFGKSIYDTEAARGSGSAISAVSGTAILSLVVAMLM